MRSVAWLLHLLVGQLVIMLPDPASQLVTGRRARGGAGLWPTGRRLLRRRAWRCRAHAGAPEGTLGCPALLALLTHVPQDLLLTVHGIDRPLAKKGPARRAAGAGGIGAGRAGISPPPEREDALPSAEGPGAVMAAVARDQAAAEAQHDAGVPPHPAPETTGQALQQRACVLLCGAMQWLLTALFLSVQRILLSALAPWWFACLFAAQLLLLQPLCVGPCAGTLLFVSRSTRAMQASHAFVSLLAVWLCWLAVRLDWWPLVAVPALYMLGCARAPLYTLAAVLDAGLLCMLCM